MREPPNSWISGIGNSMDCFRENVVKERVILLRRKDYGNIFEDVIASVFEESGSPEIIIKNNKNAVLENSRQKLLDLSIGSYSVAKLRLETKYHDKSSNFWTCYMTSEHIQVAGPQKYIQAYKERSHRNPILPPLSAPIGPNSTNLWNSDTTNLALNAPVESALMEQLEQERIARKAQDKRIAEMESKIFQLTQRLDSTRAAMENFRIEFLETRKKRKIKKHSHTEQDSSN